MLEHLRVVNLGVLADVSIDPSAGFTVITGETGAGKTLLLGGLRLLLGGQADPKAVGPFDEVAKVDGLFTADDAETGASRIVPAEGRSRSYVEGALVSAAVLAERLGTGVEIVGQNDQLTLTRAARVLRLIDSGLDEPGLAAKTSYDQVFHDLKAALERQARLGGDQFELARELDLARYQAGEIAAAGVSDGLDAELEAHVSRLRNLEEITDHLAESLRLAEDLSEAAGEVVARLRKASELDPGLSPLAGEAEALAAGVAELARNARSSADSMDTDAGALDELEDRLTTLGDLKRKYGRTLEEVLAYGERVTARAAEIEVFLADADRIDAVIAEAREKLQRSARTLSEARERAAERVAAGTSVHLADMGLARARIEVRLEQVEPSSTGADHIEVLFSSDERLQAGPIGDVASGGELSRLVLALRLATRDESAATLVFDEVDSGIGGKTALAMGVKLAKLASDSQVLCVTHLAQVAAFADRHFVVEREADGEATVRRVEGEDRVVELSRMLAGQPESKAGRTAAAELLATANK